MNNRVVITGMGVVSPTGIGLKDFTYTMKNGISGIRFIQELNELGLRCNIGGRIDLSDYTELFKSYKLFTISQSMKLAFLATYEAINHAKLDLQIDRYSATDYDTGIILGNMIGHEDFVSTIYDYINAGKLNKIRASIAEQNMNSAVSAMISGIYGLGNCAYTSSMACASSTDTIVQAYKRIKHNYAKRIFTGGYEQYGPYAWASYDILKIITPEFNHSPQNASCPMSTKASGFVPAEAAGILVLEELETALNRGAKIYGEIIAAHTNAGGQRNGGTMSAPNCEGVIKCIQDTISQAEIDSAEIDYICGHLTSTMADVLEIQNWAKALNRYGKDFPMVNALKSMTGHTIGAAGAIETIAGLSQMNNSFLHPTINCDEIHPEILETIDESRIPRKLIENKEINCFAKSSFGFGDVNSCLIIKKF